MSTTSTFAHVNENLGLLAFIPEVKADTPNHSFSASGGTGTTATVDTSAVLLHNANIATASNDFFKGLQVYFLPTTSTGALQGKVYDIDSFAVSGGTATFTTSASMAASPASGELFYILGVLPAQDVSISANPEDLERDFVRQTLDKPSSKKGLTKATVSFKMEASGLVSPSGDGSAASLDRMSAFLGVFGTRSAGTGDSVIGTPTPTTTTFTVSDGTRFAANDWILVNNEVTQIQSIATNALTVSPALSSAPSATDVVYQAEVFTPDDTGHQTHTILSLVDDQLEELNGVSFTVKVTADSYGNIVMIEAEGDSGSYTLSDAQSLDGSQDGSADAVVYTTSAASLFGSTDICLNSFEFDLGHGRQELRDTCAGLRFDVRSRDSVMKIVFRDKDAVPKNTWESSGTQAEAAVFAGNTAGDCIGIVGNSQFKSVNNTNLNDTRYWDGELRFCDDQTDAATAKKPKLLRF